MNIEDTVQMNLYKVTYYCNGEGNMDIFVRAKTVEDAVKGYKINGWNEIVKVEKLSQVFYSMEATYYK